MQESKIFLPLLDNGAGELKANFFMCLLRAFRGIPIVSERFSDSLAPRARNRAAAFFLTNPVCADCDYLLFIDGDILFGEEHIKMLQESQYPITAGIYCKKEKGIAPCLNTLPGRTEFQCGGYLEIARAGTGFLRIHRSVFDAMRNQSAGGSGYAPKYVNHGSDEWDFFPTGVWNNEYLSEDWAFCDRARSLGYKIMLDTRIQLRHEGAAIYPLEETIQKQMDETNGKIAIEPANIPVVGDTPVLANV